MSLKLPLLCIRPGPTESRAPGTNLPASLDLFPLPGQQGLAWKSSAWPNTLRPPASRPTVPPAGVGTTPHRSSTAQGPRLETRKHLAYFNVLLNFNGISIPRITPLFYGQLIFNNGARTMGKERSFQQMMLEQLGIHMQKVRLASHLAPCTKINSTCIGTSL